MLFRLLPGVALVAILCGIVLTTLSVEHKPALNFYRAVKCHPWKYMDCFLTRKPRPVEPGGSSVGAISGSASDRPSQLKITSLENNVLDIDKKATFHTRQGIGRCCDEHRSPVDCAGFRLASVAGDRGVRILSRGDECCHPSKRYAWISGGDGVQLQRRFRRCQTSEWGKRSCWRYRGDKGGAETGRSVGIQKSVRYFQRY